MKALRISLVIKKAKLLNRCKIILPQINGCIKYFDNGSKNMSFFIRDDEVLDKYNEIWDVVKKELGIKFHSVPIYDKK